MSDQQTAHISTRTTLAPALNGWEIYLEDQGSSPHTVKAFIGDMNILVSYLPPDHTIGNITTNDLNNFLDWMQNERGVPCSPKTLARRITSIKAFFSWLHDAGVVLVDPAAKVVQKSVRSPLPEALTPDETEAVLNVAEQYRTAAEADTRYCTLVELLLSTGIKKSECLNLSPNHIHLDAPEPILFVRYDNPNYRYKERKIPLSESWVEFYHEYDAIYELSDRLFPWSPRRLEYLLEDLSDEAGLGKHLSFRMCRWTSALTDWRAGMEKDKIRQKLGISKIQWREVSQKL
ncbi:MAG: site-specific integrase, partial [Chloroflexota bacterium]|nr:site-specific integrase [Chloroflexota bacterium]